MKNHVEAITKGYEKLMTNGITARIEHPNRIPLPITVGALAIAGLFLSSCNPKDFPNFVPTPVAEVFSGVTNGAIDTARSLLNGIALPYINSLARADKVAWIAADVLGGVSIKLLSKGRINLLEGISAMAIPTTFFGFPELSVPAWKWLSTTEPGNITLGAAIGALSEYPTKQYNFVRAGLNALVGGLAGFETRVAMSGHWGVEQWLTFALTTVASAQQIITVLIHRRNPPPGAGS